jgi:hypothetical protein
MRRGTRQRTGFGAAWDWLYSRRWHHFKAGAGKWVKRRLARMRRRERIEVD